MVNAGRGSLVPIVSLACSVALLPAMAALQGQSRGGTPAELSGALTFHASFDSGPDADFGLGEKRLYTAASYRDRQGLQQRRPVGWTSRATSRATTALARFPISARGIPTGL